MLPSLILYALVPALIGTFMNWPSLLNDSHTRPLFPKRDCSKLDRLQTFFAGLFLRTLGWAGYQLLSGSGESEAAPLCQPTPTSQSSYFACAKFPQGDCVQNWSNTKLADYEDPFSSFIVQHGSTEVRVALYRGVMLFWLRVCQGI